VGRREEDPASEAGQLRVDCTSSLAKLTINQHYLILSLALGLREPTARPSV
jgi:hypothetical protein